MNVYDKLYDELSDIWKETNFSLKSKIGIEIYLQMALVNFERAILIHGEEAVIGDLLLSVVENPILRNLSEKLLVIHAASKNIEWK